MKTFKMLIGYGALGALLCLLTLPACAQPGGGGGGGGGGGRRNFDPAQFRERMLARVREQLVVTNDDEWKVIEPRVGNVIDARREADAGGGFGRGRPRNAQPQDANGANANNGGGRRGRGRGEPLPEAETLQKAIDDNATSAELKPLLEKYREARKAKRAKLEQAQEELRKVLDFRQETIAVLMGLLE